MGLQNGLSGSIPVHGEAKRCGRAWQEGGVSAKRPWPCKFRPTLSREGGRKSTILLCKTSRAIQAGMGPLLDPAEAPSGWSSTPRASSKPHLKPREKSSTSLK